MDEILTITMNPAVDKSATVDDVIVDRKLRCSPPRREPGGGGINVSRAIAKLEGTSTAVFPAGGPPGAMLSELLAEESIELAAVEMKAWTRENLTIFENATRQQYRFNMPGAELEKSEWQECLDRIQGFESADYIVASGSLPPGAPDDFYARVSEVADRQGARLLLDSSGTPLKAAAGAGVYLFKPNAPEFEALTGEPFESEEQQERLARELVERGDCEVLVLSLGAAGVLFVTRDEMARLRSPTVPIRSKVGAGDSMMAAIVVGLARGMEVREAVRYGVAAGAAAVMTPGTELCRKPDVDRLYAQLRDGQAE